MSTVTEDQSSIATVSKIIAGTSDMGMSLRTTTTSVASISFIIYDTIADQRASEHKRRASRGTTTTSSSFTCAPDPKSYHSQWKVINTIHTTRTTNDCIYYNSIAWLWQHLETWQSTLRSRYEEHCAPKAYRLCRICESAKPVAS